MTTKETAMSELDDQFEKAQVEVKTLTSRPSNDEMLLLYSYFKQASVGEASGAKKPGRFDFVGKAKYDAWSELAGMAPDDAKQRYVDTVQRLLDR
jgi:diazepam-binding inhibitor (GABA receptor modulator, acyl-CoA-binding protein)